MSRPPLAAELQKVVSDFFLHVIEYGIFGALLARALERTAPAAPRLRIVAAAFVLAALYGVSDEWHQSFVPGRSATAMDAAADAIGGLAGAWIRTGRARAKAPGSRPN